MDGRCVEGDRDPSHLLKGSRSADSGADFDLKCAWQESNLLPFGPEPNALSGELQARDRFTSLERRRPSKLRPSWAGFHRLSPS